MNRATLRVFQRNMASLSKTKMVGERGSGAGKGGGAGGSIREAGGSLGEMGAAREDQFFHNMQKEQIEKLQQEKIKSLQDEVSFHEEQIKHHQEVINRLKNQNH